MISNNIKEIEWMRRSNTKYIIHVWWWILTLSCQLLVDSQLSYLSFLMNHWIFWYGILESRAALISIDLILPLIAYCTSHKCIGHLYGVHWNIHLGISIKKTCTVDSMFRTDCLWLIHACIFHTLRLFRVDQRIFYLSVLGMLCQIVQSAGYRVISGHYHQI